jgi:hypothetical protein
MLENFVLKIYSASVSAHVTESFWAVIPTTEESRFSLTSCRKRDVSFVDMTAGEASPTRLSLATSNPSHNYRDRRRGELGAVVGLNLRVISKVNKDRRRGELGVVYGLNL